MTISDPTLSHVRIQPSILYFGTPVALISSLNTDNTANLAPMSSAWVLGYTVVLGLSEQGQTVRNLRRTRECVINLPSPEEWQQVERLAPLTGRRPVPPAKRAQFRTERDKFGAAGFRMEASEIVAPPRVVECPIQLEATVVKTHGAGENGHFAIIETRVEAVHVAPDLLVRGTNHIDPAKWSPLLYVFRHYFGTGDDLGHTFRAEV